MRRTLELARAPVILGPRDERVVVRRAASTARPPSSARYVPHEEFAGKVVVPAMPGEGGGVHLAVRDGNRSVILPQVVTDIDGVGYALSVKGVGARPPLYGDSPVEFAFRSDYGARPLPGVELAGSRQITSEAWFGEAPYGAQGELGASYALMVTGFSEKCNINGFYICPTVEINELPPEFALEAHARYWYRRYTGRYLQEHRLVPSNVRVYHEADWTLGQSAASALEAFGVATAGAADAFVENYIATGVAALTLYVRTLRETKWGFRGLDYGDVYLDKDAVIAPSGRMHFVDIEGLDWILGGADVPVEERIREQFNFNFYEFMYGLDLLLRERERLSGRPLKQDERRMSLGPRFELALEGDPYVRVEADSRALDIVVKPPFNACAPVPIRTVDLR